MQVKTIDIRGKEWFDKVNGNSYFSARAIINYGMDDEKTIYVPFQYGYGEQFYHETIKVLVIEQMMLKNYNGGFFRMFCGENNIILRSNLETKCLKRDVKAWGESK